MKLLTIDIGATAIKHAVMDDKMNSSHLCTDVSELIKKTMNKKCTFLFYAYTARHCSVLYNMKNGVQVHNTQHYIIITHGFLQTNKGAEAPFYFK